LGDLSLRTVLRINSRKNGLIIGMSPVILVAIPLLDDVSILTHVSLLAVEILYLRLPLHWLVVRIFVVTFLAASLIEGGSFGSLKLETLSIIVPGISKAFLISSGTSSILPHGLSH
jgi:hypothetical protein